MGHTTNAAAARESNVNHPCHRPPPAKFRYAPTDCLAPSAPSCVFTSRLIRAPWARARRPPVGGATTHLDSTSTRAFPPRLPTAAAPSAAVVQARRRVAGGPAVPVGCRCQAPPPSRSHPLPVLSLPPLPPRAHGRLPPPPPLPPPRPPPPPLRTGPSTTGETGTSPTPPPPG